MTSYLILKNPKDISPFFKSIEKCYAANNWGKIYPDQLIKKMYEKCYFLLAISGTEVVGVLRAFTDSATVTHLSEILVAPQFQRKGIGNILIKNFLSDHYNTTIYIEALGPTAESFFSKAGFLLKPQFSVYARRATEIKP